MSPELVHVCLFVCVRAYVRACVRAWRACVRVRVYVRVHAYWSVYGHTGVCVCGSVYFILYYATLSNDMIFSPK